MVHVLEAFTFRAQRIFDTHLIPDTHNSNQSNLVNFDCVLFNTERDIQKFMSDFASSNFELHFSLEPTREPCKNNPFLSNGSNNIINFCRATSS